METKIDLTLIMRTNQGVELFANISHQNGKIHGFYSKDPGTALAAIQRDVFHGELIAKELMNCIRQLGGVKPLGS